MKFGQLWLYILFMNQVVYFGIVNLLLENNNLTFFFCIISKKKATVGSSLFSIGFDKDEIG